MVVHPLTGWFLERVAALDVVSPGFAGSMLRASAERRQVVAAFLALSSDRKLPDSEITSFLERAAHDVILDMAVGRRVVGFRSALGRSGPQPHEPRYYRYLFTLLCNQDVAQIIFGLPRINSARLRIMRRLPHDIRHASLIMHIRDIEQARDLATLVELLEANGVDRPAMARALRSVEGREGIGEFARRWSMKLRLPEHPVAESGSYRPLTHAEQLREVASRYRNCMRNYVANVLENRSAFAEVVHPDGQAVVHLTRLNGSWVLDEVYGHRNGLVRRSVEAAAISYLRSHGVGRRPPRIANAAKWAALRRLAGQVDYEPD